MYPGLAMSRSLGDKVAKSIGVTPIPDVYTIEFTFYHKIIVIASDGVWEFLTIE